MTDEEEAEYQAWLCDIASTCSCCPICWGQPCGGCSAGGICDRIRCRCDDELSEDPDE